MLDHKGVDVTDIIGRIGQDAIALAESKDAELRAAQTDMQRITEGVTAIRPVSRRLMRKQTRCGQKSKR